MTVHRFTDFLVNEVDLDHQVVHIKSLGLPESKKGKTASALAEEITDASVRENADIWGNDTNEQAGSSKTRQSDSTVVPSVGKEDEGGAVADDEVTWDDTFESSLSPFLSESSLVELKLMYLEGSDPPRTSDSGWTSRVHKKSGDVEVIEQEVLPRQEEAPYSSDKRRGKNENARGRGGRQKGRGLRSQGSKQEDHRKVLSEVCLPAGRYITSHTET